MMKIWGGGLSGKARCVGNVKNVFREQSILTPTYLSSRFALVWDFYAVLRYAVCRKF